MTQALCIAWLSWSTADATTPAVHGAALPQGGQAVLQVEGGFAGTFPTLGAAAHLGLSESVDVTVDAVTHAGLAYALGLRARWAPQRGDWAMGLRLDESFFTVEELGGIPSIHAPFGGRLALTPTAAHRFTTTARVDLGTTAGAGVALVPVQATPDGPQRQLDPALETVWAEIAATWPGEGGRTVVRLRLIVPVAGDFHPLGYVPWLTIGRIWGVR
ncbi:MAG: hypothetical protein KTR31_18840 [Myxococcales bacterium]|nr:hypothetical protein [Myxococcales bacterium]